MMKLQNIVNSIIYEQSSLQSNVLGASDVANIDTWYIKNNWDNGGKGITSDKLTLAPGRNTVGPKEILEFARWFAKEKKEKILPETAKDATDYLNKWESFHVYPKLYKYKHLVRDSKNTVFLVNHPSINIRTHWADVLWAADMDKDKIWKMSADGALGKSNDDFLDKNFPLSKKTEKKFNPSITKNDQLTAKIVVAAYSSMGGGTNEKWLTQAIEDIKTKEQYNTINDALKKIYKEYQSSADTSSEMIFIRTSRSTHVYKLAWSRSEGELGSDLAWKIWGTIGTGWQPHYNSMVVYAVLPDFIVANASDTDDGIRGVIAGETSGELKDTLLVTLIKNGICKWDSDTNSAVFPDDIKENLMYLPPNEIQDTDDYLYTKSEEPEPEVESESEE